MNEIDFSFNLLDDPWVPVLNHDGEFHRSNLVDFFRQAQQTRTFAVSNPMDRFALARFATILLVWLAREKLRAAPAAWPDLLERLLPALEQHRPEFHLFGEGTRFYQANLTAENERVPVGYLFHEIPTGTNIAHFLHVWAEPARVCPACCVLGLLRLPVFTTVGGKGYSPGLVRADSCFSLAWHRDLAATLLANAVRLVEVIDNGAPCWHDWDSLDRTQPLRALAIMTAAPRKVRLCSPERTDRCTLCGQRAPVVEHMRRTTDFVLPKPPVEEFTDPMVVSKEKGIAKPAPKELNDIGSSKFLREEPPLEAASAPRQWRVAFGCDQAKFISIYESWRTVAPAASLDGEEGKPRRFSTKTLAKTLGPERIRGKSQLINDIVGKRLDYIRTHRLLHAWRFGLPHHYVENEQPALSSHHRALELMFFLNGTVHPLPFTLAAAKAACVGGSTSEEKGGEKPVPKSTRAFVEELCGHVKNGELALLRSQAQRDLATSVLAYDLFTGLWWPLRRNDPRVPERASAWQLIKLYSFIPVAQDPSPSRRLAEHLRRLWKAASDERERARLGRRYDQLFASRHGELEARLREALLMVVNAKRREGALPALDWEELLESLRTTEWPQRRNAWMATIVRQSPDKASKTQNPEQTRRSSQ